MRLHAMALLASLLLAGCGVPSPGEPVDVVASFYPLEFLTQRLAGDALTVASLVPPGVEPHDHEPTTGDVRRVADAKLLVVQGAGFEEWLDTITKKTKTPVVVATEGLDLREGREDGHADEADHADEIANDPHTWLDPVLMGEMSKTIEAALTRSFPEHAEAIAARGKTLRADLDALHREFEAGLKQCEVRVVVTNHAAFGYMAARYKFEMIAISGLEPEAQPGPATLARVVEEVREHNLTVVYFEDLVSPEVAQAVAREANATARVLSPVEGIPDDAPEGTDYLTLMRADLAALREGMRCK